MSTSESDTDGPAPSELDALFERWAEQGAFEDAISQEGFTSFAGARVREVFPDGLGQE